METITSAQNATFKHIKKLISDKKYRLDQQEFWIDGVNFVYQAIQHGWEIQKIIYVPEAINTSFKKEILASVDQNICVPFQENLYAQFSTKENIQGIGAIVKQRYFQNELVKGNGVVLENISNPGNLGTIMRTSVAFGVKNIYIINPAVDPFNSETVRASMEAIFHLNISVFDSIESFSNAIKSNTSTYCVGTSLQEDTIDMEQFDMSYIQDKDLIVFFGSEAKGMSTEAKSLCHQLVKINMSNVIDSLNIGVSTGIVLYHFFSGSLE